MRSPADGYPLHTVWSTKPFILTVRIVNTLRSSLIESLSVPQEVTGNESKYCAPCYSSKVSHVVQAGPTRQIYCSDDPDQVMVYFLCEMAKRISIIVAKDLKNGIGNKGTIPWPMLR